MENRETILEGHSDLEKGAYLGAIASIATADREASEEEIMHIEQLCDAANLSSRQKEYVVRAATELTGDDLKRCLDVLQNSDLRYSLVTDLIAFAKSDGNYSKEEEEQVKKIAEYLHVDQKQFSLLDQFTQKVADSEAPVEEKANPSFLSSLGMKDKMQNAGINTGSLFKGFLGIAGPMLLAGMLSGMGRNRGGLFGGNSMLGGGGMFGGGLGSMIGMLSGGRRFGNTGGLFGRIFGGGF
jgi:uncharacterized tellurite resistance protein B-like protein